MKKVILVMITLCLLTVSTWAQSNPKKKSSSKKPVAKTQQVKRNTKSAKDATTTTFLSTNNNYSAKTNVNQGSLTNNYTIADPTIKALNARAQGADVRIGNSGIVGMPKRAYGFANGRLTLFTTGATSSGTITGTGTVGTGSSLGNIGSFGPAIGLNGKSPYAGSTMWGNANGLLTRKGDSAVRVGKIKE